MLLKGRDDYKRLLAESSAADREREERLQQLRKQEIREQARRAHEEKAARQRAILEREQAVKDAKEAAARAEREAKERAAAAALAARRTPLSVIEAREKRERLEKSRTGPQGKASVPGKKALPLQRLTTPSHLYGSKTASAPTSASVSPKGVPKATIKAGLPARGAHKTGGAPPLENVRPLSRMSSKKGLPSKTKQQSLPPLQALQKNGKRDLRTIEEIQNDLWRKQGKNLPYLKDKSRPEPGIQYATTSASKTNASKQQPLKRKSVAPMYPSRHAANAYQDEEDDADSFIASEDEDDTQISNVIWKMFGKRKADYTSRDYDSDNDMEAHASDIEREERRAAKAARLEDAAEERKLREAELRKQQRKRQA